jgi:hypothetical protein
METARDSEHTPRPAQASPFFYGIVHGLGAAWLFFCVAYVVPQFKAMFEEQGGQLPAISRLALDISTFACDFQFAILPALAALVLLNFRFLVTLCRRPSTMPARVWSAVVVSLEATAFLWLVVALFLPLAAGHGIVTMPR